MELPENGAKRTGAMLAEARAANGLELVDIARETRVPLRHLKALEADSHEELPALPYAIGFVKSFARAVGLDPELVANQFRTETSKSAHVPTPASLAALDERRLPSQALVFGSVAVVVAIIAGLSAWGAGAFDPPVDAPEVAVVATEPQTETPAPVSPGEVMATAPAIAINPAGTVVLTANEDVWLKIYDGTTKASVMSGTLTTGQSYTVPATPGLQLRTGKAGALDITIGGRKIAPLGGLVQSVSNVSLAAADLLARQNAADNAIAPGAAAGPAGAVSTGPTPIATIPKPKPPAPDPAIAPGT